MSQKDVPMFFQFMLPGSSENLHLMGEKCDKVILQSPLGKSWHVKVCGGKEDMWFGDGWFDFFQGHDLQVGECLVFRYDGYIWPFMLTVFDRSACEKKLTVVKKEDIDHGKQRVMEDEKLLSLASMKDETNGEQEGTENHADVIIYESQAPVSFLGNVCTKCGTVGVKRFLACKVENPHFATTIVPSNLLHDYLSIPIEFRKAVNMSGIQKMTITDPSGRPWPVKVSHRARGGVHFSSCWTEFFSIQQSTSW